MGNISTIGTAGQLRATRALMKFCRDHRHNPLFVEKLGDCLAALESKDKERVMNIMELFKHAGSGSYLDWRPEVTADNEDPEYVETVWWALNANWHHALSVINKPG